MADHQHPTQPASPPDRLEYAIHLAKQGYKEQARDLLRQIVALQPVHQAAWLWLSAVALERPEAEAALAQARLINPDHHAIAKAEQWLAKRFSGGPATRVTPIIAEPAAGPQPERSESEGRFAVPTLKRLNMLALGLVIFALLFGLVVLCLGIVWEVTAPAQASVPGPAIPEMVLQPEEPTPSPLVAAWSQRHWPEVIAILQVAEPDPATTRKLAQAHFYQGLARREKGDIEEAAAQFGQALRLAPNLAIAQQEAELAAFYLQAKRLHQQGEWAATINALEVIYRDNPAYPNVRDLLFSAYYNQGLTLQAVEKFGAARSALLAAIALHPELTDPQLRLAEIEVALSGLAQPAVAAVPAGERLILVGIAEQRMQVYERNELIYDFIVSTGEPGRDTAIGEFEIQNKIELAYASTWNLDMPNWMGIYWSGPLQNGIHSLPTVRHTGQTLWDGYLGQRVSYGCIILGENDSATLYNWAVVGTPVKIVSSLASWSPEP